MSFGGWPARITPDQEYYEDPEGSIYETSDSQTFVGYQTAQDHQKFLVKSEDVKSDKNSLDGRWKENIDARLEAYDMAIAEQSTINDAARKTSVDVKNLKAKHIQSTEAHKQLTSRLDILSGQQDIHVQMADRRSKAHKLLHDTYTDRLREINDHISEQAKHNLATNKNMRWLVNNVLYKPQQENEGTSESTYT